MTKAHTLLAGLAVAVGAFLVAAVPAYAEFTSGTKGLAQGTGEVVQLQIEVGGGTITCFGLESASKLKWTIENESGSMVEKGPRLIYKIEKWGECTASGKEVKEAPTTIGECELEAKDSGEQTKGEVSVLSTCTATISEPKCEVKIPSGSNKSFKEITLGSAGAASENLVLPPTLTGVTTEVSSGCSAVGIKASKVGKVSAFVEAFHVKPPRSPTMTLTGQRLYNMASPNGMLTVANTRMAAQTAMQISIRESAGAPFSFGEPGWATCRGSIAGQGNCTFEMKSKATLGSLELGMLSVATDGGGAISAWSFIDLRRE